MLAARQTGSGDRKHRAAKAIAAGMHVLAGNDGVDGVERGHDARGAIGVEGNVAIGRGRIAPRNHEDGEAVLGEIAHQRIVAAEIEHVILHDPGGNDQDRFGDHLAGRRPVLNELHQFVAVDDFAWRSGDFPAHAEFAAGRDRLGGEQPHRVLDEIAHSAGEIAACLLERPLDNHRVEPGDVGGRHHVQHLARHKCDARCILGRHAANFARRGAPPLLLPEKRLLQEVERRHVPCRVDEALVMFEWGEGWIGRLSKGAAPGKKGQPRRHPPSRQRQFHLPARRAA